MCAVYICSDIICSYHIGFEVGLSHFLCLPVFASSFHLAVYFMPSLTISRRRLLFSSCLCRPCVCDHKLCKPLVSNFTAFKTWLQLRTNMNWLELRSKGQKVQVTAMLDALSRRRHTDQRFAAENMYLQECLLRVFLNKPRDIKHWVYMYFISTFPCKKCDSSTACNWLILNGVILSQKLGVVILCLPLSTLSSAGPVNPWIWGTTASSSWGLRRSPSWNVIWPSAYQSLELAFSEDESAIRATKTVD